jgi:hypothetical protein
MTRYQQFEAWIAQLASDFGHTNVKRNVTYRRRINGEETRYEIDVEYGRFWWKRHIECKYRTDRNVTLKEVSKFKSVLDLLSIPNRKGILATNTTYTTRARIYGEHNNIMMLDHDRLIQLDAQRQHWWNRTTDTLEAKIARMEGKHSGN